MKFMMSVIFLLASLSVFAGPRLEAWEQGKEIRFVQRDDRGAFMGFGTLQLENWNKTDDRSEWVARHADGTFVTGYKGYLEKFKVKGMPKEENRLVMRNKKGQFVTWLAMDELLTSGYEAMDVNRDGKKDTVYVIRYNGKFVNWAKAKLENWSNQKYPVLVVRDTADSKNNGKILSYITAEVLSNGRVIYRDPETGRFVSTNL